MVESPLALCVSRTDSVTLIGENTLLEKHKMFVSNSWLAKPVTDRCYEMTFIFLV